MLTIIFGRECCDMKLILPIAVLMLLAGCTENPSKMLSHRLSQPGVILSYVTPDGWYQGKIPGNDYLTVYAEMDNGIHPNIQIEKVADKTYSFESFIKEQQSIITDYTVIQKSIFQTDDSRIGEKAESTKKNAQNIPLVMYHYYFVGTEKAYIITAICPEVTLPKYGPVFDTAIKSIEFE